MSRPEANSLAIREGALAPQSITLELQNGIAHRRCTANHTMTWQCSAVDEMMVGKLIAHREQIFMDKSQHLVGISSNAIITWLRRMESL